MGQVLLHAGNYGYIQQVRSVGKAEQQKGPRGGLLEGSWFYGNRCKYVDILGCHGFENFFCNIQGKGLKRLLFFG